VAEPAVSVVIPVRDCARFIAQAIESVAAQTLPVLETIVVDDGSGDGSGEVAARLPKVRVIRQEGRGVSAARNRGIAEARGDHVAFLDADDLWRPEKVERQLAALAARPGAGFSVCRETYLYDEGQTRPCWITDEMAAERYLAFIPSALVATRECLARVGGFDESRAYGEDVDWFVRAHEIGYRGAHDERSLVFRRVHRTNTMHRAPRAKPAILSVIAASIARRRAAGDGWVRPLELGAGGRRPAGPGTDAGGRPDAGGAGGGG
jgi:glycosyltransferase involved in cell wall biosynthesis